MHLAAEAFVKAEAEAIFEAAMAETEMVGMEEAAAALVQAEAEADVNALYADAEAAAAASAGQ